MPLIFQSLPIAFDDFSHSSIHRINDFIDCVYWAVLHSFLSLTRSENRSNHSKSLINMLNPLTLVKLYTRVQKWFQLLPLSYLPPAPPPPPHTNFHEKFKQIHEDIHISGRNQSTICQNLTTPVNRCFYFKTNSDNRVQKCFGKYFFPHFLSFFPSPH